MKIAGRILCALLLVSGMGTAGADELPAPEFTSSWFLVRLAHPLVENQPRESYPLATGATLLDAAIVESGVHRIDHALTVATRLRRNPSALERHGLDRVYRFHVAAGTDIRAAVARFSKLPGVEYAEPDYIERGNVLPNDPLFSSQWNLDQASDADVDAPEGWDATTGDGVVLAFLDSGVDSDHPDLVGKIDPGYDFVNADSDPEDDAFHGTMTGSIAAAGTDNSEGIAGVCWSCRIMPVKVLDAAVTETISVWADGILWATDSGARVINYSGGSQAVSQTRHDALRYAYDAGAVIVAATGNSGSASIGFPARYWESIAVGSTNASDDWVNTSNYGFEIDLVAPGDGVPAADIGGGYDDCFGTSCAAPHATGTVGLMHSMHRSLGREETRHLLRASSDDQVGQSLQDIPGRDNVHGWGRLNVDRTLRATASVATLRLDGSGPTLAFFETANPVADSYDFIRGDLDALAEDPTGVELGPVVCLENDSPNANTVGDEDSGAPDPGRGFFYLSRFNTDSWPSSYGGSSLHRDRRSTGVLPAWIAAGEQLTASFGSGVDGAGDVNNDGYDDVIIGASSYAAAVDNAGAAFVHLGSANGLSDAAAWVLLGDQTNSLFGWSANAAGDVNNDGFDDVLVGAPHYSNGQFREGRVYLYLGSTTGPTPTSPISLESDQSSSLFGFRARAAGDVNSDDFDDILVTAFQYTNGQASEGRAFVYRGTASGIDTTPLWTAESHIAGARMGVGADGAGDVNGDGYDDIIVGAPLYSNRQGNEGRVYVYHGSVAGPGIIPAWIVESDSVDARMGYAVAGAGDVNNDGYDDVVVGAWNYYGPEPQEGKVFVYHGSSGGLSSTPDWSFEADQGGAFLGIAVDGAGDLNGDGYDDVIVAADRYHLTHADEGRVWVFLGSGTGLSATPDWSELGRQRGARYGWRVAGAGDVDGDGYDEIIVGAIDEDDGEYNEGRAYVVSGSASGLPPTRIAPCDEMAP